MAGLDLSGFVSGENSFQGLDKLTNTLERNRAEDQRISQERQSKQTATSKFLADYLDPKDHLTGTNYDPQIVSGFQDALQTAQQLAAKGVATPDIMMAIGSKVAKLNDYSTKAKLINQQVKDSVGKLKGYTGYNTEALQQQALKSAFYGPDGKMKDISTVDPNEDYVTMATKEHPELVTSGKGLDDFVAKTPMAEYSRNDTTTYAGRSRNVKVDAKHPFYMDVQRDAKGNILTDENGAAKGMDVVGSPMLDDNNKPMLNPQTGQPFMAMNKNYFNAIMTHNPDVADYVRGQVNTHFKDAGAKTLPAEGSPQWDMMARHILGDELKTRDKSAFKVSDVEKESAPAIKVEIGQNPGMLNDLAKYESAVKLKGEYSYLDPKTGKETKTNAVETVAKIFNNDPSFTTGEQKDIGGRSVIDVTSYFPGGGLKTGRGADDVYKSIYYDPAKRELIAEVQPKTKDASGNKPITYETIPEAKAGLFVSRIAGANGVDPGRVASILDAQGYKGAKFNNAGQPDNATGRMQEEHAAKIDTALHNDNFGELKGIGIKDGTIENIDERKLTTWFRDKYAVDVKGPDGKTKTVTFKTKQELTDYIKGGANAAPATGNSGIKWQ